MDIQKGFIDAHTHPHFSVYDTDRDAVLLRAREAGVIKLIAVGTEWETSESAIALSEANPSFVYATVGFHPNHAVPNAYHDSKELSAPRKKEFDKKDFLELAQHPRVVAIGECGLDYFRSDPSKENRDKQKTVFESHIEISHELQKPLMIHCRDAFKDLIDVIRSNYKLLITNCPGVVHFFTGTKDDAKRLLDLGFSFTFGGVLTFTHDYDEVVKYIPSENILSETDAPYVAPVPFRGKRNEPAHVVEVVKKLAELKNISTENMRDQIFLNARRIFKT